MTGNGLAFFDQMNGINYSTLSSMDFKLGIVDPDSSGLTASQLSHLESSGKTLLGYLGIGAAENYRSYWRSSWDRRPPEFLLEENSDWPGDYHVKFWDPAWQKIIINKATALAEKGYSGIMLAGVDAYATASVAAAAGGIAQARADMADFVEKISTATKSINPDFKIIQNNALDLLTLNPNDPASATNSNYISFIDGIVAESTFYDGNSPAGDSALHVQYLEHAVSAGKTVLAIDYPTSAAHQEHFIDQAISHHFIPFVGTHDLGSIPSINAQIPEELPAAALADLTGDSDIVAPPPPPPPAVDDNSGTEGLISYTPSETTLLAGAYHAGGDSDMYAVLDSMVHAADRVLDTAPQPVDTIVTSGTASKLGLTANTGTVSTQSSRSYSLAMAYEITGDSDYLAQAKDYLLSWAQTNSPIGDPIANAGLLPMFKTYDLIRDQLSSSEQAAVHEWFSGIADAIMITQEQAAERGSTTAHNNHASFALLEVGTIGAVLDNPDYIHYLTDHFRDHIGMNLQSVAGDPLYLGLDYQERQAYHYVAYNMEALGQAAILMDQLSHIQGNPYGIDYNPFTVEVNGASIQHTMQALLPYASGEKHSSNEFEGSTNRNDAARLDNGSLDSVFDPSDAIPALEAADYFGHTLYNPLTGHDYNLAEITANILQNDGKLKLPSTMPDPAFLQNAITSSYMNSPAPDGGDFPPPDAPQERVKVTPYSGNHTYDAGADNINFVFYKHTGHTTIYHFGEGDTLDIEYKMYDTPEQALSHTTYDGDNAIIPLDKDNSITVVGVGDHVLTADDFHIFG